MGAIVGIRIKAKAVSGQSPILHDREIGWDQATQTFYVGRAYVNVAVGGGGGGGTVTTVSVVSANGFAGTVANPTTTPAITMTCSISGLLKGNGTAISAASQGTDYYAPGGTDVAVADGGTGASNAATARSNLSAAASGANTDITSVYLNNTGLKVKDTGGTVGLTFKPGSNLSLDRVLTFTTGDSDRTLTINGDTTLGGGSHSGTNTGDETAAGILTKLLTVDGAGSGLDADLLDGQSSAAFQPVDAQLTAIAGLAYTGNALKVIRVTAGEDGFELATAGTGTVDTSGTPEANDFARFTDANTIEGRSYSEVRSDLGLVIGTDVQAFDAQLTSIAALSYAGNALKVIRVNAGETDFELATVSGSGASTALDNLASVAINTTLVSDTNNTDDLGTSSIMWRTAYLGTSIELGHASDTTLTRSSAGDVAIEGNVIYRAGGTDVTVADGGTGRSSHTAYAVLCGGTTSTDPQQSVASVGTSRHVLTSAGASALPSFASPSLVPTAQSGNYNAAAFDLIVCNISGGSITVTLAASPTTGDVVGVLLKTASGANTVTIARNGKNIDGAAANQTLYVANDYLELEYDGTEWWITIKKLTPHSCFLTRNAAQSMTNNGLTKVAFDAESWDYGQIGDIATNDRVDIRRAGRYLVRASWSLATLDANEVADTRIYHNEAEVSWDRRTVATTNQLGNPIAVAILDCAAADRIEMYVFHNEGANQNSDTAVSTKPQMHVTEIM